MLLENELCPIKLNCIYDESGLKFIIHVGLHLFNDSSLGMHTEYII